MDMKRKMEMDIQANQNWHQLILLPEPVKENVRMEKIQGLISELAAADMATVAAAIKSNRLDDREAKLFIELLQVNYILNNEEQEVTG